MTPPRIAAARPRRLAQALGCALLLTQTGCIERRIFITSEPPGALVRLNDVEVGRTPVEVDFLHYGDYDVRLEKEGYEPLWTHRRAAPPLYEQPPLDLLTEALPLRAKSHFHWHFTLTPAQDDPDAVVERARALQRALAVSPSPAAAAEASQGEPREIGADEPAPPPVRRPVRERTALPEPPGGKPSSEPPG